ncbi:hypothetical protein CDL15_Pgr017677 [Punica granatum]|uniref:Uncharacterized protein n=1 Tax=Punica granatum TaxID=22663 RepID=A0A218WWX0_PUNGR|nr:hypothetical protein CDL15_Pgr017677 [Punica granatum]
MAQRFDFNTDSGSSSKPQEVGYEFRCPEEVNEVPHDVHTKVEPINRAATGSFQHRNSASNLGRFRMIIQRVPAKERLVVPPASVPKNNHKKRFMGESTRKETLGHGPATRRYHK